MLIRSRSDFAPTGSGDKYHVNYSAHVQPDGSLTLSETSKDDIQADINAHFSECDMASVVERLRAGIFSDMRPESELTFGDVSTLPESMSELLNLKMRCDRAWSALPKEIKEKYDNDQMKWYAAAGTPDWYKELFPEQFEEVDKEFIPQTDNNGGDAHVS